MAFTSEWEWASAARSYSTSFGGGAYNKADPITLIRSRISNAAYSSQEGAQSASLDGENGGVTETIAAPTLTNVGKFGTARSWVSSTAFWIQSGGANGAPVYTQIEESIPEPALINIMFKAHLVEVGYTASYGYRWFCASFANGDVGGIPPVIIVNTPLTLYIPDTASSSVRITGGALGGTTPSTAFNPVSWGDPYTNTPTPSTGGWSGASTFALATRTINYECISDVQSYPTKGVDWYTQTQTWRTLPVDA